MYRRYPYRSERHLSSHIFGIDFVQLLYNNKQFLSSFTHTFLATMYRHFCFLSYTREETETDSGCDRTGRGIGSFRKTPQKRTVSHFLRYCSLLSVVTAYASVITQIWLFAPVYLHWRTFALSALDLPETSRALPLLRLIME